MYVSNVDGGKLCFHSCEELDVVNDFIGLINFGWSFYYFWFQEVKKIIRFVSMFLWCNVCFNYEKINVFGISYSDRFVALVLRDKIPVYVVFK